MKTYNWNDEKNKWLIENRAISFDDILYYLSIEDVVNIFEYPNKDKYGHQKMYAINIDDYIYLVPFVENDKELFLKTIIPSRKATKLYKEKRK